jgi:hypothetical protein
VERLLRHSSAAAGTYLKSHFSEVRERLTARGFARRWLFAAISQHLLFVFHENFPIHNADQQLPTHPPAARPTDDAKSASAVLAYKQSLLILSFFFLEPLWSPSGQGWCKTARYKSI